LTLQIAHYCRLLRDIIIRYIAEIRQSNFSRIKNLILKDGKTMFNRLPEEQQKELLAFCEAEAADKARKPLKLSLAAELLREITLGEREITCMATNQKTGDIFVCFSLAEWQP
jgi:hypothetical protein